VLNGNTVELLARDQRAAAATLSDAEARYLVEQYYMVQDFRIRASNQLRALTTSGEPHETLDWSAKQLRRFESQVKNALDTFSMGHPIGERLQAVVGIGPVISAGLIAHLRGDIETKTQDDANQTVSAWWRFAGLDPDIQWGKGEKRPFNASLKVLVAYKLGESFVKTHNKEGSFYGPVYAKRKKLEVKRNGRGDNRDRALKIGGDWKKRRKTSTASYKRYVAGFLPDAHVHAMARRYTVKLFLSHLFESWYRHHWEVDPPAPFVIASPDHPSHSHFIPSPL
tara:strand:- start:247 stop:1092 length:846 start_codon:yes stop_codon:yes gene_type:complete